MQGGRSSSSLLKGLISLLMDIGRRSWNIWASVGTLYLAWSRRATGVSFTARRTATAGKVPGSHGLDGLKSRTRYVSRRRKLTALLTSNRLLALDWPVAGSTAMTKHTVSRDQMQTICSYCNPKTSLWTPYLSSQSELATPEQRGFYMPFIRGTKRADHISSSALLSFPTFA